MPAGFIVTGTNIASQGLLFEQLSGKLVSEAIGPVVILRSGEASNLKMLLKKVIKDATNQSTAEDVEDSNDSEQDVSECPALEINVNLTGPETSEL